MAFIHHQGTKTQKNLSDLVPWWQKDFAELVHYYKNIMHILDISSV